MTPKERREAQAELIDMAVAIEARIMEARSDSSLVTHRIARAKMLRAVAAELDRVPEE